MKIKNDYIKISIGKRNYEFKNMILDTYLRYMAEIQENFNNQYWQSPFLAKCFIKFDRKLEFDETSILSQYDFDLELEMKNNYLNTSTNKNEVQYVYMLDNNISNYIGRKITAIGFFDENGDVCYACLDLYDYRMSIKSNETVAILRKDTLSTEATFTPSSSKVKYPVHLSPLTMEWYEANPKTTEDYPYYGGYVSARLESVGLGTNKTQMQKEVILDNNNTEYFGNKIIFRGIFSNENLLGLLQPSFVYPSNNLYPTDTENSFTYVFLKYKLYYNIYDRQGSINYQHVDSGEWYTLSIPFKATGNFDYAISYERSDENGI